MHQGPRPLQVHAHGEQRLDHPVVQLFGDPFPLLEDLESEELLLCLLCFFIQAGILDRHAGLGREQDDGGLVVVGEHVGIALVRQ